MYTSLNSAVNLIVSNFIKQSRRHASIGRYLFILIVVFANLLFKSHDVNGQAVPFSGGTYFQNFNSLTNSNSTPATVASTTMLQVSAQSGGGASNTGWYIYGTGTTTRWGRDDGNSNTGSFLGMRDGAGGLALGSQGSGSNEGFFGVVIQNTSGATITSVTISFDAMINRNPSSTVNPYNCSYRISNTNIVTTSSTGDGTFNNSAGTWTSSAALSFNTPSSGTGSPGSQNNISPLYQIGALSRTATLTGLTWGNNQYLYIRWSETDDSGSDATAGVDNFSITDATLRACGYTQNFDGMGTIGTAPPAGWSQIGNIGGNNSTWGSSIPASGSPSAASTTTVNNTLLVSDGTSGVPSNTQGFNFGATGNSDRALGVSPTSDAGNIMELILTNASGASLSAINLSYDVRRLSVATSANELPGYWLFVSSNNGSTWTEVTALRPDITSVPNTIGVSNFGPTLVTLPSSVANGQTLRLRWVDDNANQSSPDQSLALDNVNITISSLTAATLGTAMSTTYGVGSNGVSFVASGSNVSGNITVTPQPNFEISTTSATTGFGTSAINVANNTTVWVRLMATANAGTYNSSVVAVLSGGGSCVNANITSSASGNSVAVRPLTITANDNNKLYGQTLTYGSGQTTFNTIGLQNGQTINTITITASGGTAAGAPVGTYNLVPSAATGGTFIAANYSITYANGTLTVNPAPLTITGLTASNKIYDGTNTVTVTGTVAYSGLVNGESFSVLGGPVTWAFPDALVGNNKVLTRTGSYSAPTTNYILTQPSLTANITARNLTITANAVSKEFGTALSSPVIGSTAFTSSGLQNGETIGSVTITYGSGALAGDAPNTYVNSVTPSAATGGTFNASNYSITYVSANLVVFARNLWDSNGAAAGSGNTGGNWSDNKWTDNTSGTSATGAFTNNSTPTFSAGTDGIGTFGVAVDVNRNVNGIAFEEGAVTLSAGAGALALTGSSVTVASGVTGTIAATLQGTSGLNKLGAGNLVLSGSNSFTGGITVTAGVLEAGGNTPNALNNQNASIGSGAILRFNANSDFQQPNQSITGAGTIEQNGLRISPLGNVNGHTGDLVINGGDYDCRTGQAVGNTSRVIINSSGKMTLAVAGDETIGTIEGTGELNFFGAGVPRLFLSGNTDRTFGGTITGGGVSGASDPVSGSGVLFKNGTGALTLTGSNSFLGGISLNTGRINIGNASALGQGRLYIMGGSIDNTSGAALSALTYNPAMTWSSSFTFVGTNSLTTLGTVTLANNPTVTVSANALTVGGVMSGSSSLTKAGNGTLVLSGDNTFIGGTTVSAGILLASGSSGTSNTGTGNVVVQNGATLGGTYRVGYPSSGTVTVNTGGIISPGNTTGAFASLRAIGNVNLNGTYTCDISGSSSDRLNVDGTLNLSGATLNLSGSTVVPPLIIASYGTLSGTFSTVNNMPFGYTLDYNYNNTSQIAVILIPSPSVSASISTFSASFNTTYGTASPTQSFSVNGSALTSNLVVTAPSGYQISTDNVNFFNSLSLSPSSGTVPATTVYARLTATAPAGNYNNEVFTVTSTGATTVNVNTTASGNVVNQKNLTISGISISNKTYDGNTTATITGTAAYIGLVNGESFAISGTPSAVFIDKNAGANKVVIISGYLAPSANYTITQPSLTADITRKSLTITSPTISARQYDGTTIAAAVTVGSLSGFIGIETVSATASAANYPSANVGTYSGISITYTLLDGTNGGLGANYILANGSASATIIPKVITISSPTLASRVYDGTTNPGTLTVGSLSGLVGSETLNVTGVASSYSSANVGSYTSNIAYTLSNGSGLASNYSLSNGSATGAITPKALSITSPSIASKVYDGTTAAGTLSIGTLSGLIGSETLNVGATASNYSSANVGSYSSTITYTLNNATGLASNYTLANGTASGSIVPKPLSITAPTIASKIYDATTTAGSVTVGTLFGFVGIETVTATGVAAAYASPNVGTYNNVVVTYTLVNGTNGGLAINYSLASGTSTGVITTRTLTITANDVNKQIGDILTGGSGSSAFTSTGLVGGQTIGSVTIAYGPAGGSTGQGATAGTYVGQVTPSAATGGTFSPSNYNITYVSGSIVVTNPNAVVLSNYGVAVCQDFNSLASSGTSSLTPSGWFFSESGSNANSTYTAGNGSTATGDTYSFGTGSDRTFGGLQSGSLIPTYGARIYNNTGATLNVVTISYTGKTWRVGASGRSDRIDFQYSTNATSLTTGTWTDENNLDYANPGQASTGNGSIQHSASITYTLQGLNIPQGTSLWIRWNDFDASGSDDGMGVDDVCITPIVPCTSPDLLVFDNQPTNVLQNATMSAVTVRAYCSSSGLTATGFNGNITLTASGGGCGYVSQTVAAVNGVATFNNIVFTRSPQTGITLTASGAGFSNLISNAFNVTAPAGGATTVAQQDFGSNTSLTYTTAVGGLGVFNTSNTRGVGSSNCLAFYYNDCLTGSGGSSSTATFSQSTGLTGLSNTKLTFAMAWGGPQLAGANCDNTGFTGAGLDVDDFIRLETRINGGAYVTTFQLNGNSNKQYTFSTSGVTLNHNANQTLSYASEPSAFTINLPAGTNSVDFRFTFKTNRRNEIIYLDNFAIQGNPPGSSLGLPTANAGITFNGCNGGPNQLQGSATQTVGTVSYSWMPSATLSDANISNPLAFNTTTTTYMLTITDGDNCSATSSVTVNLLSGTPGLWTGAENSDWFNCQNWASGNIPTSTVDVVIPDVTNDPDIASGVASCRNLTLSNPGSLLGMSGTSSQLNISGNVINNGSIISNGTVSFTGSSGQTITGVTSFQNLSMNNAAGLTLNNDVTVNGVLTLSSGNINAQTSTLIIASVATTAINRPGTGHIVGNLQRAIGLGTNTYSYPVGDISNYTPVTLALNNITSTGSITAKANNGDHPLLGSSALNAASSVNRYYTLTNGGVALSNYNATFEFVAGDLDFGTNTSNLLVGRYNSNWSYPAVGTLSATSAQALGVGGFGEFVLAECRTPNVYSVIGGGSYCAGSSGVAVGLSGSDVWATYQLRLNGVNIGSPVSGTGSSISFGNQTAAGTYSVVATNISSGACSQIQSGSVLITTETSLTPAVSITVSPSSAVCTATAVTFTATPSNGGATPTYVWRKNGVIVGGNSPTYSYSAPVNGDQIYVVMTSSSACVSPISATSNTIVITVTSGTLWYQDNDGDGYGSLVTLFSCTTPAGYVTIGGDCNDNNADVNPGVDEICNGIDDNCDGQIDEGLALSLYYQDLDSDGYGDASSSVFTCSMPMGYVTNNTDCNDNCSNCYPGASEIADGLDNNCNGAVDEGFGPANDMRSTALIAVLSNYYSDGSNCAFVNGTLLGATVSSEAFTGSGQGIVTGQDVWYYFTATQPGISIRVNSAVNNIAIELQTQTGSMVAWENYQSGIGNEVLNYAGLTVGQTYYIAVRNANSSQGVGGPFAMCVNMLQRGACGSSGGNYDLCGSLQANFTYANQYVFRFTDILNNNLYTYTAQSTYLVLAQVQGLLPGRTYSLRIDASYNLQRGDGSAQLLVVPGTATCSIGINAHTPMYLNALSACPNNKLPSGNITIEPWICAAVEYELRFEKISAPQLPITYLRGSTNRLIFLNQVNGLTPGTYNVFIRPRFASGTPGVTLPGTFNTTPSCLVIIGPAMLERDPGNALLMPDEKMLQIEESADANIEVYPNPSDGQSGLQLFATGLNGIAQVKIMNLEGQSVYLDNLSLTPNQISVLTPDASLPSGLYTVLVTIDNHTFKRKWLVVR